MSVERIEQKQAHAGGSSGWASVGTSVAVAIGFVLFFLLATALGTLGSGRASGPAVEQPIGFDHRLHVEDVGLECGECHEFAESESFSGVPDAETCSICHDEAQGSSLEETKLVALLSDGQPLEWGALFRQPAHVYYSHSRHVAVAGLECERCHAGIAASTRPPRRVRRLTMDDCLECHYASGAEDDCTACHR